MTGTASTRPHSRRGSSSTARSGLTGSGGNVLGHPLEVVAWLANELPRHGLALSRGDFVTTGVTTDEIYPAEAGERLLADFPGIGQVELGFE